MESQIAQGGLAALHQTEALRGHFGPVGQARSQARGGRAIPSGQAGAPGKVANLGLTQTGVQQRRENLVLRGGAVTRAKIQGVVGIHAVSGGGEATLPRDRVQDRKELVFAKKAAVRGVGAIRGIFHFAGFNEFVMDAEVGDEFIDGGAIVRGKAGGNRGNGQRARSQRVLRGPRKIRGIRASRKRDDQRRNSRKLREQALFFFFRRDG